ncbi:MAG: FAD-binding oxidoreductase [Alphaproteobacteria bacterium]|nr:FAD-binding oxidoreductase [Alphaproteobacteria bacterium]
MPDASATAYDAIIVGAGIAGASAAYFLAPERRVLVLERESQPGYHSTGRSAALFSEAYGNAAIRALTTGGKPFFQNPPAGFVERPVLSPRGAMFVGRADQTALLDRTAAEASRLVPGIRRIDGAAARAIVPVLRAGYLAGAVLEPDAMDIDVHALHQGYLKGMRAAGGELRLDAEVRELARSGGSWRAVTSAGTFAAPILINAAGAWADELGRRAGAAGIGLSPKRRTAILFDPPAGSDSAGWPLVVDVAESFYFKPDAGKLLGSPADETPIAPCDVQPEELDVALAVERIQQAADLPIARITHRWAGLRSFVADKTLVAGFDREVAGLFWLAGQGGYGIQTSPAMGRIAAALVLGRTIPADLARLGVSQAMLSPVRLAAAKA